MTGPPSLERRLGTTDAVVVGLGAMLGAGVFAAFGPAAAAAGSLLLVGLAVAAVVATCNALSSAQLAALTGGTLDTAGLTSTGGVTAGGVLEAAGLLFFAFAGYARIATLGDEVRDPARTLPRAIPLALAIALSVYAVVAVAALLSVGPGVLASAPAPLAAVVEAGDSAWAAPIVRAGAAVAALGVLLSLLAGVSRTVLAMARTGDLPTGLATVSPVHRVPARAQLLISAAVLVLVLALDVRDAIGFSSVAVLVYYAIANTCALRLRPDERRYPPAVAVGGPVGCLVLALSLPPASVLSGASALGLGATGWLVRRRRSAA